MRQYRKLLFLSVAATFVAMASASAQSTSREQLPRTRIIPYPSAELAHEGSMDKQRFMEPITEWTKVDESTLKGKFTFPFAWIDRHVFIRIEGVKQPYEVFINGKSAGSVTNGLVATEFDITKISKEDTNIVELRLLPRDGVAAIECFELGEATPCAYVVSQPRVRVREAFWNTHKGMGGIANIDFGLVMRNETLNPKHSKLYYELYANDTLRLTGGHLDVSLGMHATDTMRFGATIGDTLLWRHDAPTMLSLRVENRMENRKSEVYDFAVAVRDLDYNDGTIYINGEPTTLDWHDMPACSSFAEVQSALAEGKYALRFGAGYVSEDVLALCDKEGAYVALTTPINSSLSGESRKRGGNPSNDPAWREEYIERAVALVETTDRHASVVAYFLAEDSANGICLYEAYLAMKRVSGSRPVFYLDGGNEWNSD